MAVKVDFLYCLFNILALEFKNSEKRKPNRRERGGENTAEYLTHRIFRTDADDRSKIEYVYVLQEFNSFKNSRISAVRDGYHERAELQYRGNDTHYHYDCNVSDDCKPHVFRTRAKEADERGNKGVKQSLKEKRQ